MGYGDGFYKKTPNNILLDNSSPLFDNIVDDKVNLYVSTTGDDTNGDGSESNPYATPQRAVDSIPDSIANRIRIQIFCGTGEFDFPNLSFVPANINLKIIGSREGEIINIPAGSATFSLVSGKRAETTANVGSYSETITDGSHFLSAEANGNFSAFCALSSVSPNLNTIMPTYFAPFFNIKVCEYKTVFNVSGAPLSFGTNETGINGLYAASFIGISVVLQISSPSFKGLTFLGCKFTRSRSGVLTFYSCDIGSYLSPDIPLYIVGGYLRYAIIRREDYTFGIRGGLETTFGYNNILSPIELMESSNLSLSDTDLEKTSINNYTAISVYEGTSTVSLINCSVSGTIGLFNSNTSINSSFNTSGNITGTVTGNIVTLTNGCQAVGIKNACDGKITTSGGSEIVIGGNTSGQTFTSLPATDLASASPQLCRAT
jgi:hypothetical protein